MVLYKYRSLQAFERFVDILLNRRLYTAPFLSLNDPMEGRYVSSLSDTVRRVRTEEDVRILSLSRVWNSTLMWSHYADSHKGVVIGVEVDDPPHAALPMRYVSSLSRPGSGTPLERNIALLRKKHVFWQYEDEYRVIVQDQLYISVRIVEITLGLAVDNYMNDLIIDLAHAIDPSISVTRILKRGLDVV